MASEPDSVPGKNSEEDQQAHFEYEGARIPGYVVLIWLVFFVWGVVYFLRYLPDSIREWFFSGS